MAILIDDRSEKTLSIPVIPGPHIAEFEYDDRRKIGVKTKIPRELWEKLDKHSREERRAKKWILEQALIKYLK